VIVPIERREENAARGPESARSHKRWWGRRSVGGSPPARRRRAALEDGGTDERSRSEGTLSENAWPRSKTADGGRPGTETGTETGKNGGPEPAVWMIDEWIGPTVP